MPLPSLSLSSDAYSWTVNDLAMDSYSAKHTWESLRPRGQKQDWADTVWTLLICGCPNVGKSSFMNRVTRADVDVQPLKSLFVNKPLVIVCNKTDLVSVESLSEEDLKLIEEMKGGNEEVVVLNMSTLTEEGVVAVKNVACEKLLDQRVEEKMKFRRINDHLNRLHAAMPKLRDDKERLPCIHQVVMEAGEKEKKKTEKDLEDENGGAGFYSVSLKKKYILADESWKEDIIPEICDGHNVADFIDSDILNRLEELTSEEALRQEEAKDDEFEIEGERLTVEQKKQLVDIRKRKALLLQEHRLKKSNAQNRATVERKFDKDKKFTRERLSRDLSSLGLHPSSVMNRAKANLEAGRGRDVMM
ncbi:GTP binding domain-containing protein [Hirschfeldia incana]|nr:GTP binding domain-containing protein [Hirschfeldia incana]